MRRAEAPKPRVPPLGINRLAAVLAGEALARRRVPVADPDDLAAGTDISPRVARSDVHDVDAVGERLGVELGEPEVVATRHRRVDARRELRVVLIRPAGVDVPEAAVERQVRAEIYGRALTDHATRRLL